MGVAASVWVCRALMAADMPSQIPIPISLDLTTDYRVFGFTLAITLLTGLMFGLAPALRASRGDLVTALKTDTPQPVSLAGSA